MNNGTLETPNATLDGWEIVLAADGSRWFGKVVEEKIREDETTALVVMEPAWETMAPTKAGVLVPQMQPNGQVAGMAVEWPANPGGDMIPVLNDKEAVPPVRLFNPSGRIALCDMPKTRRAALRRMISEILEKAKPQSHSNVLDFGGAGPKVQ